MRNLKARIALLALGSLVLLNACNAQEDKKASTTETVVATVNGTPLHQSAVDNFLKQAARQQNVPDTPAIRKQILEELVTQEIAYQDALKQGFNKRPEVKQQIDFAEKGVVASAYIQDFVKTHPPSDDLLKVEYDKIKAQIGDKQYHVRHILVKTEKEALDILAQLKKGAKFDKLASSKSLDQGSKANGGDLGFNPPTRFVKPFSDALVALKKGETVKAPVRTQFGFHIIQVEDIKDLTFDEVKVNLAPRVQQEQLSKHLESLRAKAKVEYKLPQTPAPATELAPAAPAEKK